MFTIDSPERVLADLANASCIGVFGLTNPAALERLGITAIERMEALVVADRTALVSLTEGRRGWIASERRDALVMMGHETLGYLDYNAATAVIGSVRLLAIVGWKDLRGPVWKRSEGFRGFVICNNATLRRVTLPTVPTTYAPYAEDNASLEPVLLSIFHPTASVQFIDNPSLLDLDVDSLDAVSDEISGITNLAI